MKRHFILFIMLITFVCSCDDIQKQDLSSKEDSVIIVPSKVNLGTVDSTHVVVLNFEIVNKSSKNIKIVSKAKSCGCTYFKLPSTNLKANSRMKVKVDFDPKQVSGNLKKSVFLRLEDGKILLFKFFGTVS